MILKLILCKFKEAVIVINGNGSFAYMYNSSNNAVAQFDLPFHNEPSEQIYNFIKKYPNRPVFITGFHCVGMSVTFINEKISNFDNVVIGHASIFQTLLYFISSGFVFNYMTWKKKEFKTTHLYLQSENVLETCLDYEKQIDVINHKYERFSVNQIRNNW